MQRNFPLESAKTVASQIEIFSKLTILALGMPILLALLETIHAFLT